MDAVYIFKQIAGDDATELRYSLRSLSNLPHERVFLVGDTMGWARNIQHIDLPQDDAKADNVGQNFLAIAESDDISEDFILLNDDFFIMKQQETVPTLHWGKLYSVLTDFRKRYGTERPYTKQMGECYDLLYELGITEPLSYELHAPMVFNKAKLRQALSEYNGPISHFRTYYGNRFSIDGDYMADSKVFLEAKHNDPAYEVDSLGYLRAQPFLSTTSASFKHGLVGRFIDEIFSEKSIYETE